VLLPHRWRLGVTLILGSPPPYVSTVSIIQPCRGRSPETSFHSYHRTSCRICQCSQSTIGCPLAQTPAFHAKRRCLGFRVKYRRFHCRCSMCRRLCQQKLPIHAYSSRSAQCEGPCDVQRIATSTDHQDHRATQGGSGAVYYSPYSSIFGWDESRWWWS